VLSSYHMKTVYLIQSIEYPNQRYIGITLNLEERMQEHNTGKSPHTSKYHPWKLIACISFSDEQKALEFEKYLKVGSGHAFANKRLW